MLETLIRLKESLIAQGISGAPIDAIDEAIEAARQQANQSAADVEAAANKAKQSAAQAGAEVIKTNNEVIASHIERANRLEQMADGMEKAGLITKELADETRGVSEAMKEQAQGAAAATQKLDAFGTRMGLNKKMTDSFTGSMLQAGNLGFAALGSKMKEMIQPQALFAAGLAQMEKATMELATKFDAQQAQLSKATGTSGEYNDMMYEMQETNRSFGVDVEDAAKAIEGLHTNMTAFSQMNSDTQAQLATTSARMEALGVSGDLMGKQFDSMIMGMGMTADMADSASLELVNLGDQIGVAASVISEDFANASSELAKYGPQAIDVFKGMAAAAKATGIEVGNLMQISGQFDTFEGAAEGAGKLNAILGGGVINSMDLLNGTEEERIRLLIESMQASGKNFESLNRFEKQAIANAAGIKDMSEANKLFSMSLGAYDEMQSKAGAASAEQAKLEERAQAAQSFSEKLAQLGQAFAVAFMPILDFLHGFANMLLEINDMTGGLFIPVMVALTGVIYFLSGGFSSFSASLLGTAKTAPPTSVGITQIASATMTLVAAILPALPAITALGFAIAGLGLAIAAPFIAIAAIVTAFTNLFTAMLEAPKAIIAAVAGMIAFAYAGAFALQILAVGLASAVMILAPVALQMLIIAPGLAAFGAAAAIAVLPLVLLGKALESMAAGLMAFKEVGFGSIVMAAVSIALFSAMLIPIAAQLGIAGALVGVSLMLLGKGLMSFAQGIIEFNDVGLFAMFKALASLGLFAIAMKFIATDLLIGGLAVGIGTMVLGGGLKSLGKGLKEFNKVGGAAIAKALGLLGGLGIMLIFTSVQIGIGGVLVGFALQVLGDGLLSFAIGLRKFNRVTGKAVQTAMASLYSLAFALIFISAPLFIGGLLVGGPLMLIGEGLQEFGRGLRKFNKIGVGAIASAIASLFFLGISMTVLAPFLLIAGLLVGGPLMLIGEGLQSFAKGIKKFNSVAGSAISTAMSALLGMAFSLVFAAPMFLGMLVVGGALLLFGNGLKAFARGIRRFNKVGGKEISAAIGSLFSFAISMLFLTPILLPMATTMAVVGAALILFGIGLKHFGKGLKVVGKASAGIMTLANAMGMLALIGITGAFGFAAIGAAIMGIAFALMFIPEKKALALGFTLDGYARAMQAVSALTPESVEAANQVVEAAGKYVEIQAEMRMPAADAFVAAMSSVFGGDSDSGGGQDIVLKVNGREFARAVDVAINRQHNLSMD